ncbi:MAG: hypothetical protein LBI08_02190 [Methanomassiliicoccaceae archaeon]|jgi:hypothetical protein|nr:hypothetical protein [Methanomassiliicoccaceae archaeon]
MIAITAVFLLAAAMAVAMVPTASAADDTFNTYSDVRAESYMAGVGKPIDYSIYAACDNGNDVSFTARVADQNGNSVSRVSPSSGRSIDSEGTTLTVYAPAEPGSYTLIVDFIFTESSNETKTVTKTAPLRVVVPVTLSAKLVNSSGTITHMNVWFVVDGNEDEKIGEQEISIGANSSQMVTHEWVVEGLSDGKHTMKLMGEVGPIREDVRGLDEEKAFYVGQTSYKLTEALLVIVLIVLLIIMFFVMRKPVKNVGKPKGRR